MRSLLLFSLLFFAACSGNRPQTKDISVLPRPDSVRIEKGFYVLDEEPIVSGLPDCETEVGFLQEMLLEEFGLTSIVDHRPQPKRGIRLWIDARREAELGPEGYTLTVDRKGVLIEGAAPSGVFYGLQTLRQLIQEDSATGEKQIPRLFILDKPAFAWRAFMLDEARHFKGGDVVKQLLDEMAALKMNTFHWHLTDDQGWRIEIKKYPLLTEVGSKRDSTEVGGWGSNRYDGKPHSGFYTQQQITEIVDYARARHITVVPEIGMPGHAEAAIAAYPFLGTQKKQISVKKNFGVAYDVFGVHDPKVREVLQDILLEVMNLFPGNVIHIGGDEVRHQVWQSSPEVASFMQKQQIKSLTDLQVWFTNDMASFIASKDRRMMGWNEIMGGKSLHDYAGSGSENSEVKLAPGTIVHFWEGETDRILDAAQKGYDVVNSQNDFTYLDYSLKQIPLEKAYSFSPIPEGMPEALQSRVLGGGCQMWSEWIPTVEAMNRQVFPRLAAYAEVFWTPARKKDASRFTRDLQPWLDRWTTLGYYTE